MKRIAILALAASCLMLIGCTEWAPKSTISSTTWNGPTTHTQVMITKQGWPLMWGALTETVSTPETYAADATDKKPLSTVAGTAIGGTVGVLTGSPALMTALGTAAGAMGQALDKRTTDTLPASPFVKK